ncbi:unnamed protein product, partial [Adineta steineri]
MARTSSIVIIALLLQQYIQIATGVTCQFNPCQLTAADALNGYCCYNIPPNYVDSLCTCPNNIAPVVNAPCRYAGIGVGVPGIYPTTCTKTCVNGGVCNVVNGQQVLIVCQTVGLERYSNALGLTLMFRGITALSAPPVSL